MRIKIDGVVANTRGVEFPVKGFLWHDGSFFLFNPRPDRYPGKKGLMGSKTEKTLYWANDDITPSEEASKFLIKSMLADMSKKKESKRGKK